MGLIYTGDDKDENNQDTVVETETAQSLFDESSSDALLKKRLAEIEKRKKAVKDYGLFNQALQGGVVLQNSIASIMMDPDEYIQEIDAIPTRQTSLQKPNLFDPIMIQANKDAATAIELAKKSGRPELINSIISQLDSVTQKAGAQQAASDAKVGSIEAQLNLRAGTQSDVLNLRADSINAQQFNQSQVLGAEYDQRYIDNIFEAMAKAGLVSESTNLATAALTAEGDKLQSILDTRTEQGDAIDDAFGEYNTAIERRDVIFDRLDIQQQAQIDAIVAADDGTIFAGGYKIPKDVETITGNEEELAIQDIPDDLEPFVIDDEDYIDDIPFSTKEVAGDIFTPEKPVTELDLFPTPAAPDLVPPTIQPRPGPPTDLEITDPEKIEKLNRYYYQNVPGRKGLRRPDIESRTVPRDVPIDDPNYDSPLRTDPLDEITRDALFQDIGGFDDPDAFNPEPVVPQEEEVIELPENEVIEEPVEAIVSPSTTFEGLNESADDYFTSLFGTTMTDGDIDFIKQFVKPEALRADRNWGIEPLTRDELAVYSEVGGEMTQSKLGNYFQKQYAAYLQENPDFNPGSLKVLADEGLRVTPYEDAKDNLTFGIGHLVPGEETAGKKYINEQEVFGYEEITNLQQEDYRSHQAYLSDQAERLGMTEGYLGEEYRDTMDIMVSLNTQLGPNWHNTSSVWKSKIFDFIENQEYDKAISYIKGTGWYSQTPNRADNLIAVINTLKGKKAMADKLKADEEKANAEANEKTQTKETIKS